MKKKVYQHVAYLEHAIQPDKLRKTITRVVKALKPLKFDAVAFRGASGLLVGPSVALRLKKTMILVRKEGENNHSYYQVEGDKSAMTYVIVDDCVDSGRTARNIERAIAEFNPEAVGLGVLEYFYYGRPRARLTTRYRGGE